MQTLLSSALGALMLSSFVALPALAADPAKFMADFYKVADSRPFNAAALAKHFSDDFVDHDPGHGSQSSDKDAAVGLYASLAEGAPDSRHEITFIEKVGTDKALVRWRFKGTHTGNLLGIPATGKSFDFAALELWEIKDGKIVGLWHVEEIAKMLEQLGLAQ